LRAFDHDQEGVAVDETEDRERALGTAWLTEHTGEVVLNVRAPTLPALFAAGGRGLAGLMLGDEVGHGPETAHDHVVVEARDREALLVAWLDELVYRAETAKAVFTRFEVKLADERHLAADIHGVTPTSFRNPVKAATYHRLSIAERDGEYVAAVVLDV
jgi:SHS2 domain-containing protein